MTHDNMWPAHALSVLRNKCYLFFGVFSGAGCRSVVRKFAHGAMGCRIDPSWGGPIQLFFVPVSAPRLV